MSDADSAIFRLAKIEIAERGWRQGGSRRHRGDNRCCALEALGDAAVKFDPAKMIAAKVDELEELLDTIIPDPVAKRSSYPVITYNDAPGRTVADINALFDKAIEIAEARA